MSWKSLLSSLANNIKNDVKREITKNLSGQPAQPTTPSSQPTPSSRPTPEPQTRVFERERSDGEWVAYFREILQSEFPQYTFRENVAVVELVGDANDEFKLYKSRPQQAYKAEWGKPYSFVLYQDGLAKGVVMLGKGHSHDSNVKYLVARMYAKKCGLPYINFYTQMPNERDYVIGRIRKFLI